MSVRVLIVDDEAVVRDVLSRYLEEEGFRVETAADGESALDLAARSAPDVVVLDLMLPRIDGLEVLRRVRERRDVPVVLLTAKGEEVDRVVGLEVGADDYVAKPFSPREVVARVRAVLRRSRRATDSFPATIVVDDLEIDRGRKVLRRGGLPVHVTRKEFELLELLASHPGRTFRRSELLEDVWDSAWDGDSATVTVHVRRLRRKVEADPSTPRHLLTVWGIGYRWEP
ncbi:MAG TPA: response regulator transcription factor [Actinomycetota bacterium]|nr:response regulator transcription factor [Actinomycetota bacterium]